MTSPKVSWHSFDLKTGRRGAKVAVRQLGSVSRIIGEPTDTQLEARTWDAATGAAWPGWEAATLPGRSVVVALDEEASERPLWAGLVLNRVRRRGNQSAAWAGLTLATLEHYFSRRFVGDLTFTNTNQATIAADLLASVEADGPAWTAYVSATPVQRDRTYVDDEDKTLLSVLTDLMNVERGLEFTVEPRWADADHTTMDWVVRFAERLGVATSAPVAMTMPGVLKDFEYIEDFGEEWGANDVLAVSSGEGEARPKSSHHVAATELANGWAKFETRFTPSTSITATATLDAHAAALLEEMRAGIEQLEVVASLDAPGCPLPGVDVDLGDDVQVSITSPGFPAARDADGLLQPGLSRRLRLVGWTLDFDAREFKPLLRRWP